MLQKTLGNPKITKPRIIVLVEDNMNVIMKHIWNKCMIPVVEKTNFLSPEQFGNKKGYTSLDALLLKIGTMDLLQLYRLNRAIVNNDATACYNCMIPE
eukprot:7614746-Ditylum_brightwellii.AAC.3